VVGCNPLTGIECDGDWTADPISGTPYCNPTCSAGECCVPRDGLFQCVPRTTGGCPAADIFVDASQIESRYTIEEQYFAAGACEIAEGCVDAPGMRRLLRFDTYTPNIGGADLFLGQTPTPGTSTDIFEWSACHNHFHFNSYAHYELLSSDGCCVTVTGRKQAFCLEDFEPYDMSIGGSSSMQYGCEYQGIQRGWQDVYYSGLPCQWIDITDVPPGNYQLRIQLNTEHQLLESNYDNNDARVPVVIP
jgi:hypothetical protein